MFNEKPTKELLNKVFKYQDELGRLVWAKHHGRGGEGIEAGTKRGRYVRIKMRGVLFNARDLIWIWHNGDIPAGGLKNINGDERDNRIANIAPRRKQVVSFI